MDAVGYALAQAISASAEIPPVVTEIARPAPLVRAGGYQSSGGAFGEIGGIFYSWQGTKVQAYDPVANTWTTKTSTAADLGGVSAFGVINGRLIIVHDSQGSTYNNRRGYYNPSNNTSSLSDDSGAAAFKDAYTMGAVTNLGLHAVGGRNSAGLTSSHMVYSDYGGVWTSKASAPFPLMAGGVAAFGTKLYLVDPAVDASLTYSKDLLTYDTASNTWSTEADIFSTRTVNITAWTSVEGDLFYAPIDGSRMVYQRPAGSTGFKAITLPVLGAIDPQFGSAYPSNTYHVLGTANINIAQSTNSSTSSANHGFPVYKFTGIKPIRAALATLKAYLASK